MVENLKFEDIQAVEYDQSLSDQVCNVLAEAYMLNNPFVKALGIDYEMMYKEFETQLNSKMFPNSCIVKLKNTNEVLGCMFWMDFAKVEVDLNNSILQVPSKAKVRKAMKDVTLKPLKENAKLLDGSCGYASCFGVNAKYQGLGLTGLIMYFVCLCGQKQGFTCILGNIINDTVKRLIGKLSHEYFDPIDMSDLELIDGWKPFQGLGLKQQAYIIYLKGTQEFLEKVIFS